MPDVSSWRHDAESMLARGLAARVLRVSSVPFEESRRQRSAVATDGRYLQHQILGGSVPIDHWRPTAHFVPVGSEQLWVIERRTLPHDARIGQRRRQELDQIVDLLLRQVEFADLEVDERGVVFAKVAAAVVELDRLPDRCLTAVVKSTARSRPDCAGWAP